MFTTDFYHCYFPVVLAISYLYKAVYLSSVIVYLHYHGNCLMHGCNNVSHNEKITHSRHHQLSYNYIQSTDYILPIPALQTSNAVRRLGAHKHALAWVLKHTNIFCKKCKLEINISPWVDF